MKCQTGVLAVTAVVIATMLATDTLMAEDDKLPIQRPPVRGLYGLDLKTHNDEVGIRFGPDQPLLKDALGRARGNTWLFRADEIVGTPVGMKFAKDMGYVEDIIIDVHTARVRYAVIDFPDLTGDRKLYAVPWGKLLISRNKEEKGYFFTMKIPITKVRGTPGFLRDNWPTVSSNTWSNAIDRYYGIEIEQEAVRNEFGAVVQTLKHASHLVRSTTLDGLSVVDVTGRKLGTTDGCVIDITTQKVRYGIVQLAGIELEEKRFPIPYAGLRYHPAQDDIKPFVTLRINHLLLAKAPYYDIEVRQAIRDARWPAVVDRYYGENLPNSKLLLPVVD